MPLGDVAPASLAASPSVESDGRVDCRDAQPARSASPEARAPRRVIRAGDGTLAGFAWRRIQPDDAPEIEGDVSREERSVETQASRAKARFPEMDSMYTSTTWPSAAPGTKMV